MQELHIARYLHLSGRRQQCLRQQRLDSLRAGVGDAGAGDAHELRHEHHQWRHVDDLERDAVGHQLQLHGAWQERPSGHVHLRRGHQQLQLSLGQLHRPAADGLQHRRLQRPAADQWPIHGRWRRGYPCECRDDEAQTGAGGRLRLGERMQRQYLLGHAGRQPMSPFMSRVRRRLLEAMGGLMVLMATAAHAGSVTYVYTDPQGTPLAEADASGNITATYDYAPYGSQALGSPPNGPGYTGHVNDPDTGLVYMQARYYDPSVGRFVSTDPVEPSAGNPFNFNRFAYANNSPIDNMDPDGRMVWDESHPMNQDCYSRADCRFALSAGTSHGNSGGSPTHVTNLAAVTVVGSYSSESLISGIGSSAVRMTGLVALGLELFIWDANDFHDKVYGHQCCYGEIPLHLIPQLSKPKYGATYNEGAQPDERDLTKLKELDGYKAAEEAGYVDAHEAKKGRGAGHVDIYNDKTTGKKWLWNGVPGGGKEEL